MMKTEPKAGDDVQSLMVHNWRRHASIACISCGAILTMPDSPAEKYCEYCEIARAPCHKILMTFRRRDDGWECQFSESDTRTPLRKKLLFADPEKVRIFIFRAGGSMFEADQDALERALSAGRGAAWLHLSPEQYQRLK